MQKRFLGKTDIKVSPLGLGTVKFGRNEKVNYPEQFSIPTDQEICTLLNLCKQLGINLLDTAPAYGASEVRLGKLLSRERNDWIICSKAGEQFAEGESSYDFSKVAIIRSVEESLKRLQTDYLDILLIHSNGDDLKIIHEHEVFLTLERLKKEGKIRAYGMSTKTIHGGLLTVQIADVAMVTFNPDYQDEKIIIDRAHELNKGIFIKKAFGNGHLAKSLSAESCLEFIFKMQGITSVIVGTINPAHLKANVSAISSLTVSS